MATAVTVAAKNPLDLIASADFNAIVNKIQNGTDTVVAISATQTTDRATLSSTRNVALAATNHVNLTESAADATGHLINLSNGGLGKDIYGTSGNFSVNKAGSIKHGYYTASSGSNVLTCDWTLGDVCKTISTENITTVTFTGALAGQIVTLILAQGAAFKTIAGWAANIKLAGGAYTWTATNVKTDVLTFVYDGALYSEVSRAMNESQ